MHWISIPFPIPFYMEKQFTLHEISKNCYCCSIPQSCLSAISWTAACQASLSFTISQSLCKLNLCYPLLLLPSIFPSIRILFQWVSILHQVAKVLDLQLQHQSFQWVFRVDFQIDWFDLLKVQGTLKSLLQHHNLKASILWHSSFFIVQHSQPYMTTVKKHSFDYMDLCWQSDVFAF